eukprot:TRINITY_DN27142_c0_g1_i2.p1 TRINITY_DN27142_c0_g1~~TRINITY_DN27142_c0_g1_i2.p1  ORF type:complete len:330 (+),score=86.51 TRINITY_DN27142_c0_g1_i2:102-1091(+)
MADSGAAASSLAPTASVWRDEDLEEQESLGRGAAASVCLARHLPSGALVALKRSHFPLYRLDASEAARARGEVRLLRELTSEDQERPFRRACQFFGCFEDSQGRLALVLERVEGFTLHWHLRSAPEGRFELELARRYIAEVVAMFEELHRRDIIYRDLKLTNLIVDANDGGRLRLVDFGLAKRLERTSAEAGARLRRTYSAVGTAFAMAPELLEYGEDYNEDGFCEVGYTLSPDWWTLGILACELLAGRPPFGYRRGEGPYDDAPLETLAAKSPESIDWAWLPGPLAEDASGTPRAFVSALLQADPSLRLGARTGAAEVRSHAFFADFD